MATQEAGSAEDPVGQVAEAPPRIRPSATAHGVDRSRGAIRMIATTTPIATSARIQVIPVAIENAAPGLRSNEK